MTTLVGSGSRGGTQLLFDVPRSQDGLGTALLRFLEELERLDSARRQRAFWLLPNATQEPWRIQIVPQDEFEQDMHYLVARSQSGVRCGLYLCGHLEKAGSNVCHCVATPFLASLVARNVAFVEDPRAPNRVTLVADDWYWDKSTQNCSSFGKICWCKKCGASNERAYLGLILSLSERNKTGSGRGHVFLVEVLLVHRAKRGKQAVTTLVVLGKEALTLQSLLRPGHLIMWNLAAVVKSKGNRITLSVPGKPGAKIIRISKCCVESSICAKHLLGNAQQATDTIDQMFQRAMNWCHGLISYQGVVCALKESQFTGISKFVLDHDVSLYHRRMDTQLGLPALLPKSTVTVFNAHQLISGGQFEGLGLCSKSSVHIDTIGGCNQSALNWQGLAPWASTGKRLAVENSTLVLSQLDFVHRWMARTLPKEITSGLKNTTILESAAEALFRNQEIDREGIDMFLNHDQTCPEVQLADTSEEDIYDNGAVGMRSRDLATIRDLIDWASYGSLRYTAFPRKHLIAYLFAIDGDVLLKDQTGYIHARFIGDDWKLPEIGAIIVVKQISVTTASVRSLRATHHDPVQIERRLCLDINFEYVSVLARTKRISTVKGPKLGKDIDIAKLKCRLVRSTIGFVLPGRRYHVGRASGILCHVLYVVGENRNKGMILLMDTAQAIWPYLTTERDFIIKGRHSVLDSNPLFVVVHDATGFELEDQDFSETISPVSVKPPDVVRKAKATSRMVGGVGTVYHIEAGPGPLGCHVYLKRVDADMGQCKLLFRELPFSGDIVFRKGWRVAFNDFVVDAENSNFPICLVETPISSLSLLSPLDPTQGSQAIYNSQVTPVVQREMTNLYEAVNLTMSMGEKLSHSAIIGAFIAEVTYIEIFLRCEVCDKRVVDTMTRPSVRSKCNCLQSMQVSVPELRGRVVLDDGTMMIPAMAQGRVLDKILNLPSDLDDFIHNMKESRSAFVHHTFKTGERGTRTDNETLARLEACLTGPRVRREHYMQVMLSKLSLTADGAGPIMDARSSLTFDILPYQVPPVEISIQGLLISDIGHDFANMDIS
eukprot:Clim_evm89s172 gene=Clim_evmTU89s172